LLKAQLKAKEQWSRKIRRIKAHFLVAHVTHTHGARTSLQFPNQQASCACDFKWGLSGKLTSANLTGEFAAFSRTLIKGISPQLPFELKKKNIPLLMERGN
jgi:hypothetical protein